jgi:F-type H+-transporting ATPase subunit epsilon
LAGTFRCSIVTPAASVFEGDVRYVSFPAWDGQTGVMAGRSPLLARLGIGALRLDAVDGGEQWMMVDGGFAQMSGDELTILTERAEPAAGINVDEAEQALERANAEAVAGGVDRDRAEAAQQRARARVALARR